MQNNSQDRNVVAELAYLFRATDQAPPVLLLGAGASYRSGIPLAAEAVKRIAKASYAWTRLGMDERFCNPPPSDWMPYLESHNWFIRDADKLAENFPAAVRNLLTPRERRRRFLRDLVVAPNGISDGYRALAQIMLRRLCWTVFTTNFDQLIADSLRELRPNVREVIEINRTQDDFVRFGLYREFQVVYLHGAVEFYRDKNDEDETKRLDEELVKKLRPMLRDSPLIVVGYRGYEQSVVKHLLEEGVDECQAYPNGVFWCRRKGSPYHENVDALRSKISGNFHDLEIEGFDELMVALEKALAGYSRLPDRASRDHAASMPGVSSFDQQPMEKLTKEHLDMGLILSTLAQYFDRLRLGRFDAESVDATMVELGIVRRLNGTLVPTVGGFLLFGRDVSTTFPFVKVQVTIDGRQRQVVEGNLVTQFEALNGVLNNVEINPILRMKGQSGSHDNTAYPPLALREACVNLLMHRNYEATELARIDFLPGRQLTFANPGGLLSDLATKMGVDSNGTFTPKRGLTVIRNPVLADIFYGLGRMDKAGSGLADIVKFMVQHGGAAEFLTAKQNNEVVVVLKQAAQDAPVQSNTAVPLPSSEVFITNLLPVLVMPKHLTSIPLKNRRAAQSPISSELRQKLPEFIYHDDHVLTFAAPELFSEYPKGELLFDRTSIEPLEELIADDEQRRLIVWLIHRHWAAFLWRFSEDGLTVEARQKRAYFLHRSPYKTEVSSVTYSSRMGRKIRRGVVKRRGAFDRIWHENEGLQYAAVFVDGQWALQVKPIYIFTGPDGWTPLPPHTQTRRATRRFKFDRNRSVEDDLTFWARYLSQAGPVINIGGFGVEDLVLSSSYCQAEIPTALLSEVD